MNEFILRPEGQSLSELAEALRAVTARHAEQRIRFALEVGAILSAGRALCESADCGIEGGNPNIRFGKWLSDTVSESINIRMAHRYRALFDAFGHLPIAAVLRIGIKNGAMLATASEDIRARAIEHVTSGGTLTASDVQRLVQPQPAARPAPAAAERVSEPPSYTAPPAPRPAPAGTYGGRTRAEIEASIATYFDGLSGITDNHFRKANCLGEMLDSLAFGHLTFDLGMEFEDACEFFDVEAGDGGSMEDYAAGFRDGMATMKAREKK
ncbi:MAG TPA: hypothetical protein VNQ78_09815 [Paracoccus sp. (in: a-proteobacteria)]|uniref:hypothetical protein n=1 Tax=Paracoccus sp. TaxID=267 RepID=UPI002CBB5BF2|nr:hypothetical protein [Paracoccus sp. (in: a-proteobacteria)]HWL56954.1 hypothetical protein [Paracoccus sp. (in: a-proteobacteria)]